MSEESEAANESTTEQENNTTDDDLFPEETPQSIRRDASSYINRLREIGGQLNRITKQTTPIDDDVEDSEKELDRIGLHCQYNRWQFLIILPLNETYNLFQAEYDLIEDMIYTSDNTHLGGSFNEMEPEEKWSSYQETRENFELEQIVALCKSNRSVPIPTLEAWFSLLRCSSEKFLVEATQVQYEFIGGLVQRRLYTSPTETSTQELYETVTQLLALRHGIQDIIGSSYLFNGISVPDNFATIAKEINNPDFTPSQTNSPGFQ